MKTNKPNKRKEKETIEWKNSLDYRIQFAKQIMGIKENTDISIIVSKDGVIKQLGISPLPLFDMDEEEDDKLDLSPKKTQVIIQDNGKTKCQSQVF